MTVEQSAAYVQAQASAALIEAMGMHATNQQRAVEGASPAYTDVDFNALIERYGIHHNAVCGLFETTNR